MIRAYKTELAPNNQQGGQFRNFAGASRFVFNWGLATWKQWYGDGQKLSGYALKKHWNSIKYEQVPWITEIPYAVQEAAFRDLDAAFKHFFRRVKNGEKEAGYPKFKSRRARRSFALRSTKIQRDRVRLTGIGWVRLKERWHLPLSENHKLGTYATISEKAGRWYIAVTNECPDQDVQLTDAVIGIDLGLKTRAMISTGKAFDVPPALRKHEAQLKRLQRELSRRTKGGSNWQKTKEKVQRMHAKIVQARHHWQHQISHHVTYDLRPRAIVLEDLNVRGMVKNRHLSKAVSDAGFYELRRQIEYKAAWLGIEVIIADKWYPSSKTCSRCGHKLDNLTLSDRVFRCPECWLELDRDYNAALNLALLADRPLCEPSNRRGLPGELECSNASL